MLEVDPDIDVDALPAALRSGWGIDVASLEHLPVGGGGYHWRCTLTDGHLLFVTVDDMDDKDWLGPDRNAVALGLTECLGAAAWLRDGAGINQVIAPLLTTDGRPLIRIADRWTLSVKDNLVGESYPFGRIEDADHRRAVLDIVTRIHTAHGAPPVPDHRMARVSCREVVDPTLADPDRPWDGGPFGSAAQALIAPRADDLRALLADFDAAAAAAADGPTVLTHGEPHAANTMTVDGVVMLFDWDTIGTGPPERDLWLVLDGADGKDAAAHAGATGHQPRADVLDLYRRRWRIDDLVHCIALLSGPHIDSLHAQDNLAMVPVLLDQLLDNAPWTI